VYLMGNRDLSQGDNKIFHRYGRRFIFSMIDGVKLIEKVKETLDLQEAKVIMVMRELPYQTITIKIEEGKVIHKEQVKSIKD
jgi:hypothetical protein